MKSARVMYSLFILVIIIFLFTFFKLRENYFEISDMVTALGASVITEVENRACDPINTAISQAFNSQSDDVAPIVKNMRLLSSKTEDTNTCYLKSSDTLLSTGNCGKNNQRIYNDNFATIIDDIYPGTESDAYISETLGTSACYIKFKDNANPYDVLNYTQFLYNNDPDTQRLVSSYRDQIASMYTPQQYNANYDSGYSSGKTDGARNMYTYNQLHSAQVDAENRGKTTGLAEGRQYGYDDGYSKGLNKGRQDSAAEATASRGWHQVAGKLSQISLSGDKVCGVNRGTQIFCAPYGTDSWSLKNGLLKHISIDGDKACGVNVHDDIYCADNINNPQWNQINGKLKQIDVSGEKMCGVNSYDDIYCANYKQANWSQKPGKLKHISINSSRACGVNSSDDIFCADNVDNPQWQQIRGKLSQIDVNGDKMCGVNANGSIYCADYKKDNWVMKPGLLKHLSIHGGNVYGVNANDDIYHAESMV
jgi:hypothetical protein